MLHHTSRMTLLAALCLFVSAVMTAGCADTTAHLEKHWQQATSEDYYVKKKSPIWARPDRTSKVRGYALAGNIVCEVDRNKVGWSKVQVTSKVSGWMPSALLTKKAVKVKSAAPAAAAPAAPATKTAPAAKKETAPYSPAPAKKSGSGSPLSPKEAHAGEKEPAKEKDSFSKERKADPKKFEPL